MTFDVLRDLHGGFFDQMLPPAAGNPQNRSPIQLTTRTYGVRHRCPAIT
jgi:hypothetical protein